MVLINLHIVGKQTKLASLTGHSMETSHHEKVASSLHSRELVQLGCHGALPIYGWASFTQQQFNIPQIAKQKRDLASHMAPEIRPLATIPVNIVSPIPSDIPSWSALHVLSRPHNRILEPPHVHDTAKTWHVSTSFQSAKYSKKYAHILHGFQTTDYLPCVQKKLFLFQYMYSTNQWWHTFRSNFDGYVVKANTSKRSPNEGMRSQVFNGMCLQLHVQYKG